MIYYVETPHETRMPVRQIEALASFLVGQEPFRPTGVPGEWIRNVNEDALRLGLIVPGMKVIRSIASTDTPSLIFRSSHDGNTMYTLVEIAEGRARLVRFSIDIPEQASLMFWADKSVALLDITDDDRVMLRLAEISSATLSELWPG